MTGFTTDPTPNVNPVVPPNPPPVPAPVVVPPWWARYRKFVVAIIVGPGLAAAAHFLGADSWLYYEITAALTAVGIAVSPANAPPKA